MSSSHNTIDFSSSLRSPAMTPNYGRNDYYRKMLQLQDKLRKSQEESRKLEQEYNNLRRKFSHRYDACMSRLRQRYVEFLEEQREKDERNHKLLGALDRVDGSLALITAKTDRLNVLRKQYEGYLLRSYASRPPSSIAVDNTIEIGQNNPRYGRRSNVGYSTPSPRQFQDLNRPASYASVTANGKLVPSAGYDQSSVQQNQQTPRICIEPRTTQRQDSVSPPAHGSHLSSQAYQRFSTNQLPELPEEPSTRTIFERCAPIRRPETAGNIPTRTYDPFTVPREHLPDFRQHSPAPSNSNLYNLDSGQIYDQAPPDLLERQSSAATSAAISLESAGGLAWILAQKANSSMALSPTTPGAPGSGRSDASAFCDVAFRKGKLQIDGLNSQEELDREIRNIIRLHRGQDMPQRQAEKTERDLEENTSDDLFNVTLSEDKLDPSAEDKAAAFKKVTDDRVLSDDIARVLKLANNLASRKPKVKIANEPMPDTKQEISEAVVVPEGRAEDENVCSSDDVAPLPELDDVDEKQGGEPVTSTDLRMAPSERNVEIVTMDDTNLKDETRCLPTLSAEREEDQVLSLPVEQSEQAKDVHESLEDEKKQAAIPDSDKESSLNEEASKILENNEGLTVSQPEQKQEEYDVTQDLEPWNMDGLAKQIREVRIEDDAVDANEQEHKDEIVERSNVELSEPEKQISVENAQTDQSRNDEFQETVSNSTKSAVPEEDADVSKHEISEPSADDLVDQSAFQDPTFRQSVSKDTEEEEKYDVRPEYGEQNTEIQGASYENQNQGQVQGLDNEQEAQQVEQYEYEQTTGYENGAGGQGYQEYDGQNEQYGEYADDQYGEEYANDPNNQYDPNAQYEQNQEYGDEYNQQYDMGEGYENDPNQSYAYAENVSNDPNYENAENYEQQEYQEDIPPQEEVQSSSLKQTEQESEEKLDVPASENPKPAAESENNQPKKKKDVIKSLLDSDTDSTIERNVSNTESDFDFN